MRLLADQQKPGWKAGLNADVSEIKENHDELRANTDECFSMSAFCSSW